MEFKYDVRDLKFILKEWLPLEEVLACDRFKGNFSIDDVDMLLNEGYKVAKEVVNPSTRRVIRLALNLKKEKLHLYRALKKHTSFCSKTAGGPAANASKSKPACR